ncbi:enterobactin synthase subunit F [Escherichia coli]|uniref:Enterobactin synthase subunit F n=1 Tax=Escherichia coli TaxID=562 RepID=A0A2X1KV69_ECOLX|nr:enterobactin synthase subunit F [Escherichia coli]
MAFSNPFDDPQGAFYILRNAQGPIQSVAATMRLTGRLGHCVSAAVTGVLPAVAGSPLAYSDTDEFYPVAGGTMSQHLPLVAAQPGIWMAEKLSELPSRLERGALR